MIRKNKILSLISLSIYAASLLLAQYFHSHEGVHIQTADSYAIHSHFADVNKNASGFLETDFHLSDNIYFNEEHIYSSVKVDLFAVSFVVVFNQTDIHSENLPALRFFFNENIPISLRNNCVHSASNSSPPLA